MKKNNIKHIALLGLLVVGVSGCSRPIPQGGENSIPTSGVVDTEIPTSGLLSCPGDLKAQMNYRPGDIITPRFYKKISQFGCKLTLEYKTRFLQGITVGLNQEEIARRCRTEAVFLYKKDFWLTSSDSDYHVYSASFLLDKFRGSVLQTNISGTRNVQCFATVEALFRKS